MGCICTKIRATSSKNTQHTAQSDTFNGRNRITPSKPKLFRQLNPKSQQAAPSEKSAENGLNLRKIEKKIIVENKIKTNSLIPKGRNKSKTKVSDKKNKIEQEYFNLKSTQRKILVSEPSEDDPKKGKIEIAEQSVEVYNMEGMEGKLKQKRLKSGNGKNDNPSPVKQLNFNQMGGTNLEEIFTPKFAFDQEVHVGFSNSSLDSDCEKRTVTKTAQISKIGKVFEDTNTAKESKNSISEADLSESGTELEFKSIQLSCVLQENPPSSIRTELANKPLYSLSFAQKQSSEANDQEEKESFQSQFPPQNELSEDSLKKKSFLSPDSQQRMDQNLVSEASLQFREPTFCKNPEYFKSYSQFQDSQLLEKNNPEDQDVDISVSLKDLEGGFIHDSISASDN